MCSISLYLHPYSTTSAGVFPKGTSKNTKYKGQK